MDGNLKIPTKSEARAAVINRFLDVIYLEITNAINKMYCNCSIKIPQGLNKVERIDVMKKLEDLGYIVDLINHSDFDGNITFYFEIDW